MTTKKYRLETVLRIRDRAREEAARQVALRLQQLQSAEEELARCEKKLQECRGQQTRGQAAMNEEAGKGIQAREILAHHNYLNDLRELEIEMQREVENQIQVVSEAEKALDAARAKLTESARELKSIEKHKANWLNAREQEDARREQKISDEIGAILHNRRENS
jgi:flagellar export protein FliJ